MSIRHTTTKGLEDPVLSLSKKKQVKLKEFREYLVDKQVLLGMVKFLLALRSSESLPGDPVESLKDYFGTFRSPEWDELSKLEQEMNEIRNSNDALKDQIEKLKKQKQDQIELNRQRELEKQQKLAEEEAKKQKKGGKK